MKAESFELELRLKGSFFSGTYQKPALAKIFCGAKALSGPGFHHRLGLVRVERNLEEVRIVLESVGDATEVDSGQEVLDESAALVVQNAAAGVVDRKEATLDAVAAPASRVFPLEHLPSATALSVVGSFVAAPGNTRRFLQRHGRFDWLKSVRLL